MQYLLLIYEAEKKYETLAPAENQQIMTDYMAFTKNVKESGHMKAGDALQPTRTATTVRVRDGKVQRTDGPFAETKEQLGGYYLIDAKDLDEATMIASKIPSAKWGSIEVRPILVYGAM